MVLLRGSARQMERGVAYKLYVMVGSRKYIPLRSHVRIVMDVLVTGSHLEATGRRSTLKLSTLSISIVCYNPLSYFLLFVVARTLLRLW